MATNSKAKHGGDESVIEAEIAILEAEDNQVTSGDTIGIRGSVSASTAEYIDNIVSKTGLDKGVIIDALVEAVTHMEGDAFKHALKAVIMNRANRFLDTL